jgi:hypothetical protein
VANKLDPCMICEEAPCVCNKPAPKKKAAPKPKAAPASTKAPRIPTKRVAPPSPVSAPAADIHAAMREGQAKPAEGGEEAGLRVLVEVFWDHLRPEDQLRFQAWKPTNEDRLARWKARLKK